jgi:hypothetical protein
MPWGLRRFQQSRQLHFLTFSCYRRRANFESAPSRNIFETSLEKIRRGYGLCVYGYVVMPEHVHLLVSEPERDGFSASHTVVEAVGRAHVGVAGCGSLLASALLRFQCMERAQVRGEAALHSSQPGAARAGRAAGGLEVEQLPPLCERSAWDGGNRIAVDGAAS